MRTPPQQLLTEPQPYMYIMYTPPQQLLTKPQLYMYMYAYVCVHLDNSCAVIVGLVGTIEV